MKRIPSFRFALLIGWDEEKQDEEKQDEEEEEGGGARTGDGGSGLCPVRRSVFRV